jgi:hypothetical protein
VARVPCSRLIARGLVIWAAFCTLLASHVHADPAYSELDIKVALVGKIAGFIRWPPDAGLDDPERPFELVVLGATPLDAALRQFYDKVRISGHRVFVRTARNPLDIGRPHMLFVATSATSDLDRVVASLATAPILIAGDTDGFAARGAAVNLYREGDHLRFEISRQTLAQHRLQASYQLLARARLVDESEGR